PAADSFERAVFRRSLSHRRGKFYSARDQISSFKFSIAGQCPSVAPYIAEHKFHRSGKAHRILVRAPLRLKGCGSAPDLRSRVKQQQSAFPLALRLKAQRVLCAVAKGDLDVPSPKHACRLRLAQRSATHLGAEQQNEGARRTHLRELTMNPPSR